MANELSPEEQEAFRKWVAPIKATYTRMHAGESRLDYIARMKGVAGRMPSLAEFIQQWVDAGKPGYLTPGEKLKEIGEGPFLKEDYSTPEDLYELGEGFEWKLFEFHPETGLPLPGGAQWVAQPIEESGEIPTGIGAGTPSIVSINGYDFIQWADEEGNVTTDPTPIGRTAEGDTELTPFQEAQIDRWGLEQGLAGQAAALERERFEWQVSQATLTGQESQRERELADRLRLEQELAELGGPADWIKRWEMIKGIIPKHEARWASKKAISLLQEAQNLRSPERDTVQRGAMEAMNRAITMTGGDAAMALQWARSLEEDADTQVGAERLAKEMQAERLFAKADKLQARDGRTPPTPEWLPQFLQPETGRRGEETAVPSAGEPIERLRIQTPSGQQWSRTPWSVRQGLSGFADWAGFRPMADILDQMAMMQTRTPTGAGQTRWAPARQRA